MVPIHPFGLLAPSTIYNPQEIPHSWTTKPFFFFSKWLLFIINIISFPSQSHFPPNYHYTHNHKTLFFVFSHFQKSWNYFFLRFIVNFIILDLLSCILEFSLFSSINKLIFINFQYFYQKKLNKQTLIQFEIFQKIFKMFKTN